MFSLMYGKFLIGRLSFKDDIWTFKYSDAFQFNQRITPLCSFPDPQKIYKSRDLWTFFLSRIPSLYQPEVKEVLIREQVSETDTVNLLRLFGQRTIANPYELIFSK